MLLYSNNLSAVATISSLIMLEILPICFSCTNNYNLSQSSLGFSSKIVVEVPEAMIAVILSNLVRDMSLVLFLP